MKKLEAFFLVVCILLGAFSLSAPVGAQNIQQHNWNYVVVEKNGTVKEIPLRTALTVPEINPVEENVTEWNGTWSQVGGVIYVDRPIVVTGNVELRNVTLIFNGTSDTSYIEVRGNLTIDNSIIAGNGTGRISNHGNLNIGNSEIYNIQEIRLSGSSYLVGNIFTRDQGWYSRIIVIEYNNTGVIFVGKNVFNDTTGRWVRYIVGYRKNKNIKIVDNTFISYGEAIDLWDASNVTISNNIIKEKAYDSFPAIAISGNGNISITNNIMDRGGISIGWAHGNWVIRNNTLGGYPILFIANQENKKVTGTLGQVIIYHSHNITLSNSTISKRNDRTALAFEAVHVLASSSITIENCNITAVITGIHVWAGKHVKIINNTIQIQNNWGGNSIGAVSLDISRYIVMRNNVMTGGVTLSHWNHDIEGWTTFDIDTSNKIGNKSILYVANRPSITIDRGDYAQIIVANVSKVTIRNFKVGNDGLNHNLPIQIGFANDVTLDSIDIDNWWGLWDIGESIGKLVIENSRLQGDLYLRNNINSSVIMGNHFKNAWVSIFSSNCTVTNNTFEDSWRALDIGGSGNRIYKNRIQHNKIGIYLESWSRGNFIYDNFFNNTINAYIEPGSVNFWNTTVGNYWSDYNGTDSNGDGIGDTPYIIDENNIDYLPLMSWGTHPVSSDAVIIIDNETVRLNATKAIALKLHYIKDTKLGALQFNLTFDPELIKVENVTPGNAAEGSFISANINNSAGRVTVGIVNLNGLNEGIILKVTVKGISTGETELHGIPIDASDTNANPLRVTFTSGIIKVVKRPRGDINGDNRVTAVDALLYLRYAVGLSIDPYTIDPTYDDLNNDGKITATDALIALRIAVGLEKLS